MKPLTCNWPTQHMQDYLSRIWKGFFFKAVEGTSARTTCNKLPGEYILNVYFPLV